TPGERHILDRGAGAGQNLRAPADRRLDLGMPVALAEIEAEGIALALEIFRQRLQEIERRLQGLDVALIRSLGHLHEEAEIRDRAGERSEMRDLIELARQDGERDAPEARLQPERPAEAGRDPD